MMPAHFFFFFAWFALLLTQPGCTSTGDRPGTFAAGMLIGFILGIGAAAALFMWADEKDSADFEQKDPEAHE